MDSTQINNSNTLEALDCISRKMASEGIARLARNKFSLDDSYGFYLNGLKDADYLVSHLPPVQPKQGKWNKIHWKAFRCSECNRLSEYNTNFCPNCGADMRGNEDGTD